MATLTTVYDFFLPVIGGDIDTWGGFHNNNFEKLDGLLSGVQPITPNLTEGAWKIGGVAVTPSAAELNVLNGIAVGLTAAELSVLDGYTGNTADLNIVSGAAASGLTAAELLYVNGVTSAIQTQLNGKQAIDAFLTDLSTLGDTLVAGDLLYAAGVNDLARLSKGAGGTTLRGGDTPVWRGLMVLQDQKPSGTGGGSFNSGAWRTRDLNTTLVNTISGSSLATNQITLAAGTYKLTAKCPALRVNNHQCRLQNITDGTTIQAGSSEITEQSGAIVQNSSVMTAYFTLTGTKVLEVQHLCGSSFASSGFGNAVNSGIYEVYTDVTIEQM